MKYLIFYDQSCPLCQRSIEKIKKKDKHQIFEYIPLQSEKAKALLPKKLFSENTLVLLEEEKRIWIRAKAIFRIFYLLGGKWKLFGWLCYLPGLDIFYRMIAHHRHLFR